MNKEHGIGLCVVFADLLKALDTIYHQLKFELFKKFAIPDRSLNVIKILYKKFKIQVSNGKCKNLVDYTSGVKYKVITSLLFFLLLLCNCLQNF